METNTPYWFRLANWSEKNKRKTMISLGLSIVTFISTVIGLISFAALWFNEKEFESPTENPNHQYCDINVLGQWLTLVVFRGLIATCINHIMLQIAETDGYTCCGRLESFSSFENFGYTTVFTFGSLSVANALYLKLILQAYHPESTQLPSTVINCSESFWNQFGYNLISSAVSPALFAGILNFIKYLFNKSEKSSQELIRNSLLASCLYVIPGLIVFYSLWASETEFRYHSMENNHQLCNFNVPGQWLGLVIFRGLLAAGLGLAILHRVRTEYSWKELFQNYGFAGVISCVFSFTLMSVANSYYIKSIIESFHPNFEYLSPEIINCPDSFWSQFGYNVVSAAAIPPLLITSGYVGDRFFQCLRQRGLESRGQRNVEQQKLLINEEKTEKVGKTIFEI